VLKYQVKIVDHFTDVGCGTFILSGGRPTIGKEFINSNLFEKAELVNANLKTSCEMSENFFCGSTCSAILSRERENMLRDSACLISSYAREWRFFLLSPRDALKTPAERLERIEFAIEG